MAQHYNTNVYPEEQEFCLADRKKLSRIYILRNYPYLNPSEQAKMSKDLNRADVIPAAVNPNMFYTYYNSRQRPSSVSSVTETTWVLDVLHQRDCLYRELGFPVTRPTTLADIQLLFVWYHMFREMSTTSNKAIHRMEYPSVLILQHLLPGHKRWPSGTWYLFIRGTITAMKPDRRYSVIEGPEDIDSLLQTALERALEITRDTLAEKKQAEAEEAEDSDYYGY